MHHHSQHPRLQRVTDSGILTLRPHPNPRGCGVTHERMCVAPTRSLRSKLPARSPIPVLWPLQRQGPSRAINRKGLNPASRGNCRPRAQHVHEVCRPETVAILANPPFHDRGGIADDETIDGIHYPDLNVVHKLGLTGRKNHEKRHAHEQMSSFHDLHPRLAPPLAGGNARHQKERPLYVVARRKRSLIFHSRL